MNLETNPELVWGPERESIDQLLARMANEPDFRTLVSEDPEKVIGDLPDTSLERSAKPKKCGPLRTSCPPGRTCANNRSCVKTLISIL